ncbi:hypothetical protein [Haloferula sp. BvORR071]|uniref:hypothetical protein n=1 Tax=Haloferula sp. BvORR071 TaxID=1396141 RepID=UPI00054F870C|nr:hypothetical protein [Haloferula sp. BvORR071]
MTTTVKGSFAEADALPFVPYAPGDPAEVNQMLAGRFARPNRRRYHYPSLPAAIMCLTVSLSAVMATSRQGEATLISWVPKVYLTMDQAETAMLGSESHDQISFKGGFFH